MKWDEFYWQSADKIWFYAQNWQPDTDPRGVVCLVHGLGEHSGRYVHVAQVLCNAGYACLAFDLRGHGKTTGQRGHTPSLEAYMKDIQRLLEEANRRYPLIPCFLYGHSLGANLIVYYILTRQPSLAGAVVTGLALKSHLSEQRLKVLAVRLMGSIWGNLSMPSGLNQDALSRDIEIVRAYRNDPLVHDRATLRFGKESLAVISYVSAHAAQFHLPLLIMHGAQDKITYPESSHEFVASLKGQYTFKLWDNMYHELHNEIGKEEVLAFLVNWLDENTLPSGQSIAIMGK